MLNRTSATALLVILLTLGCMRPAAADEIFPIPYQYQAGSDLRQINTWDELRTLVAPVNDRLRQLDARFAGVHDVVGAQRLRGELEPNLTKMTKLERTRFVAAYLYLETQLALRELTTAGVYAAFLHDYHQAQTAFGQAAVAALVAYGQQQLAKTTAATASTTTTITTAEPTAPAIPSPPIPAAPPIAGTSQPGTAAITPPLADQPPVAVTDRRPSVPTPVATPVDQTESDRQPKPLRAAQGQLARLTTERDGLRADLDEQKRVNAAMDRQLADLRANPPNSAAPARSGVLGWLLVASVCLLAFAAGHNYWREHVWRAQEAQQAQELERRVWRHQESLRALRREKLELHEQLVNSRSEYERFRADHQLQHQNEQGRVHELEAELAALRPLTPLATSFAKLATTARAPIVLPMFATLAEVFAGNYASPYQRAQLALILGEQEVLCDQISRRDGTPQVIDGLPRQPKLLRNILRERDIWQPAA